MTMSVIAAMDDEPMSEAMPEMMMEEGGSGEAVKLKEGDFRDQDSFHKGSGKATMYRAPDGTHLLRLEELKVTNGPRLHVLLAAHADPMTQNELKDGGYHDLGRLKGNVGNQNYPVPEGVDVAAQMSVVIYCKPFSVIFSRCPAQELQLIWMKTPLPGLGIRQPYGDRDSPSCNQPIQAVRMVRVGVGNARSFFLRVIAY